MGKIFVVGVGPGSEEFLTHAAKRAVENADILVGGKNALALFPIEKPKKAIDKNLDEVLKFIKKNRQKNIAILTSGDPGFFSILELILKNFPKEKIEVVPGISSMQLCFAKIKEPWHDTRVISLHGRDMERLLREVEKKKLVILTDNASPPNKIAEFLLDKGIRDRRVVVCDNLSQPFEKVIESDLERVAEQEFSGNCVMVLFQHSHRPLPQYRKVGASLAVLLSQGRWHTRQLPIGIAPEKWEFRTAGIPDEYFFRDNIPITKEEIRVVTLSKARIREDSIIYDIGAGCGTISIEAALLAKAGRVFSIEKNPERVSIIKKNIKKFGVRNIELFEGEAPNAIENLPMADRIIIGGSGGRLKEILQKCSEKLKDEGIIVINAITIDTLRDSTSILENLNFNLGITQVSVSRAEERIMKALNPVFIIDASR
ncbi:MAG: precorrin-6y C5,15-methyltransferase (decarboxylating) subunit CbiE [Methanobacteriota archaeon]